MNLLFWLALGFMIIGAIVLIIIGKRMKTHTVKARIWFIAVTTVWGVVSILLVPWLIGTL